MEPKPSTGLLAIPIALLLCASGTGQDEPPAKVEPPAELAGFWQHTAGSKRTLLQFAPRRCAWRQGETFDAHLARFLPGRVELNYSGIPVTWKVRIEDGKLEVRVGKGKAKVYERADAKAAAAFEVTPTELPKPKKVKRRDLKTIQKELAKRARKDQQARTGFGDAKKIAALDKANTAYLHKVTQKVGWIDVRRFGADSADHAWTLLIHCDDLALMRAGLAAIESEDAAKKLRNGENFAALFDRVQLRLGGKQRYGTQIVQDPKGKFLVFPLEQPDRIEALRKELGLPTFAKSLETQAKWTGGEKPTLQTGW